MKKYAAALAGFLLVAGASSAGPPWIAIEYPVNPHDPATRGAFVTVRTYHHGDLVSYQLEGSAEGLVNGRRVSAPLQIRALSRAGTYVVFWRKPAQGNWALVLRSKRDGQHAATAVVQVDRQGRVALASVPSEPIEGGQWLVPKPVTSGYIDALLRAPGTLAAAQR